MSDADATKKATKVKKPKTAPSDPTVAHMVNDAITNLNDKKGSSLIAIKKYIDANYKVDVARKLPLIRRYLKSELAAGKLSQTKGCTGASGSFKFCQEAKPNDENTAKKPKTPTAKKSTKMTIADMVYDAITNLNDTKGSSLIAIKKYMAANYKVDVEKKMNLIRRDLRSGLAAGKLSQTKGCTGASGSFKIVQEKKPNKENTAEKPQTPQPTAKKSGKLTVADMVDDAITNLNNKKGSSCIAIKKYMAANYKVDVAKLGRYVHRYLKLAVAAGKLSKTTGCTGASASFKMCQEGKLAKKPKAPKSEPKKAKSPKKSAAKPNKAKTPTKKAVTTPKKATTPTKKAATTPEKAKTPKRNAATTPEKAKTPKKKKVPTATLR